MVVGEFGVEPPHVGVRTSAGGQALDEAVFGEGVQGGGGGDVGDGGLFGQGADPDVDEGAALDVGSPDHRFGDGAQDGGVSVGAGVVAGVGGEAPEGEVDVGGIGQNRVGCAPPVYLLACVRNPDSSLPEVLGALISRFAPVTQQG